MAARSPQKPTRGSSPTRASSNGSAGPRASATSDRQVLDELLDALRSVRSGDFTVRLPARRAGVAGEVARAFNDVVEMNQKLDKELARAGGVVGREGGMGERVNIGRARDSWASSVDSVNGLIGDLARPTVEVA